jgi:hypothetical protein
MRCRVTPNIAAIRLMLTFSPWSARACSRRQADPAPARDASTVLMRSTTKGRASPDTISVQVLSHERPRGRGMRMVEAIADRWGAEDHKGGKRVWFDMYPSGG